MFRVGFRLGVVGFLNFWPRLCGDLGWLLFGPFCLVGGNLRRRLPGTTVGDRGGLFGSNLPDRTPRHPGFLDRRWQRALFSRNGLLSAALHDRVGNEPRDQAYRADSVVVAGDDVVHDLRVAIGVGEGDDRYLKAVSLLDQQFLALRVYDEDRAGKALHLSYAREVAPELLVLAV